MTETTASRELWGAETRKAVENFPVSGEPIPAAVVHWLGRIKAAEQARIRDAADTLIFASDIDETRDALRDIGALAEHLLTSGRWLEDRLDALVMNLLACGPSAAQVAA